jgi:hypothetical protein
MAMEGGMRTFAASAKSNNQREESGRSGYLPEFSVVQTQRMAAASPFYRMLWKRPMAVNHKKLTFKVGTVTQIYRPKKQCRKLLK